MASYAKQLEQVLDLMLKADARKLQIKEGKLSIDPKEDKALRKYTAEARELTKSILVSMSRDILSEQDLAALNDATDELESGDLTADSGDEASDRIEDQERGFTNSGDDVDDIGAEGGMDGESVDGGDDGDDVGELVDKLLSLVGPDEAIDLVSDAGADSENPDELDEFANIDDTAVEGDVGGEEDVNLDDLLAGLGAEDDAGGDEDFGGDVDADADADAGDDEGDEGGDDDFGSDDEEGDADADADADAGDDEGDEDEEKEPVTESLRSRTRVNRRGK